MDVIEKIRQILTRAFPPPDKVELEDDDGEGIIGLVASDRFVGMEVYDRISMLWDILDRELTREERRRIVTIVTVTPKEEIAHTA